MIRKVDAATGVISTLAGNHNLGGLYNGDGLTATATAINYPEVVAVDPSGTVVFSDRNGLVRKIDPDGLIDFGDQKVSTASSVQTVTVSNIGNLPLHFDSTTPYAIDGDFTFTSGGTRATLRRLWRRARAALCGLPSRLQASTSAMGQ